MKRHLRMMAAIVAGLLVVVLMPLTASATHSWNGYHWERSSNPVALQLGDNLASNWKTHLATTSADWDASSVIDTSVVNGDGKRSCRASDGRIEVCNGSYGNNGWLGIASISISGSHIVKGTVKLNDTYFNSASYNTSAWRLSVMCQEVGHIWGLTHNDEDFNNTPTGTCMDYSNDPTPNQHPDAHDFAQLETIYSHLDAPSGGGDGGNGGGPPGGCKGGPKKCGSIDPSGGSWGQLVRIEAGGAASVYELNLGNGNKKITHVRWAN